MTTTIPIRIEISDCAAGEKLLLQESILAFNASRCSFVARRIFSFFICGKNKTWCELLSIARHVHWAQIDWRLPWLSCLIVYNSALCVLCHSPSVTDTLIMGALQRGPQNFGWVGHNAFGLTNNWPVCSLILRKISRIGATRRQIFKAKMHKFAFCRGSAADPVGGAQSQNS